MGEMRRPFGILIALAAIGLALVVAINAGLSGGSPSGSAVAAGSSPAAASLPGSPASPGRSEGGEPSASPNERDLDTIEGIDSRVPVALPGRIELYAGAVSVTSGQPLTLHVSTVARRYAYVIERLDATVPSGRQLVASSSPARAPATATITGRSGGSTPWSGRREPTGR